MVDFLKILESPLTKAAPTTTKIKTTTTTTTTATTHLSRTIRDLIKEDLQALYLRRIAISQAELPATFRDRDAAAREFGLARDVFVHSLYRTKLLTRRLAAGGTGGLGSGKKALALPDLERQLGLLETAQEKHRELKARLRKARASYATAEEELARTLAEGEALGRDIALCEGMLSEVERFGLRRIVDGGVSLVGGGGQGWDGRVREGLVGYVDSVLGGEGVQAVGWL